MKTRIDLKRFLMFAAVAWIVSASSAESAEPELVPGTRQSLNRQVTRGKVIHVDGPPSKRRDRDKETNSIAKLEGTIGPRRAIKGGVYQRLQENLIIPGHPDDHFDRIVKRIRERYEKLILTNVPSPKLTRIDVEPLTLVYPIRYDGNSKPVEVHARRLTIRAVDRFGDKRHLVAYFVNYDKVPEKQSQVMFQVNGHFGRNLSRQGLGLENHGGFSGAALGLLAIKGVPFITFDDHDTGESSPGNGKENGLFRTLANLRMMDDALLVHFDRVDGMGLSGGCERLYHFLLLLSL